MSLHIYFLLFCSLLRMLSFTQHTHRTPYTIHHTLHGKSCAWMSKRKILEKRVANKATQNVCVRSERKRERMLNVSSSITTKVLYSIYIYNIYIFCCIFICKHAMVQKSMTNHSKYVRNDMATVGLLIPNIYIYTDKHAHARTQSHSQVANLIIL